MNMISKSPVAATSGASMLASKAVLVSLNCRAWLGKTTDKDVTREVLSDKGAREDAGGWTTRLMEKKYLSPITANHTAARALHYRLSRPWSQNGQSILPIVHFDEYASAMREFARIHEENTKIFIGQYPGIRDDYMANMERLGRLYDPDKWPPVSQIGKRFSFGHQMSPVPTAADFRVDVGDAVRAELEHRIMETAAASMARTMAQVAELVATMAGTLETYKPATGDHKAVGTFRDSLVTNIRDLARTLPAFDLTDSSVYRDMVAAVEKLSRIEPEKLRADPDARQDAIAAAKALAADCEALANDASRFF